MRAHRRIPWRRARSLAPWCLRLLVLMLAGLAAGAWHAPARAAAPEHALSDLELRAVYLYNFVRFTDWPARTFKDAGTPLTIAVLGEPEFAAQLTRLLDHKQAGGRTVTVVAVLDPADCLDAQLVYIGAGQEKRLGLVLPSLAHRPIMTVSSIPSFLRQGGMIRLVQAEERLRFEINQRATREAGLQVSARLLQLATVVVGR